MVWRYFRFTLSFRDVEDLMDQWHLDEMVVRMSGDRMYLWLAVDDERAWHAGAGTPGHGCRSETTPQTAQDPGYISG